MAEALAAKAPPGLAQARIAGRIDAVRRKAGQNGQLFFTLLKLPAADQYSSPSTMEVRSSERLGASGDEVSILVRLGGYSRSYQGDDGEGGKATVRTAENVLDFVGHA